MLNRPPIPIRLLRDNNAKKYYNGSGIPNGGQVAY